MLRSLDWRSREIAENRSGTVVYISIVVMLLVQVPVLLNLPERGFYSDDWYFLRRAANSTLAESFQDNILIFGGLRPLGHAAVTLQYELFGSNELASQIWLATLHLVCTISVFNFCRSLFRDDGIGLVCAAFFAVIPWHTEVVFWPMCSMLQVAFIFTVVGGAYFIRYIREPLRRREKLVVSLVFYGVAILFYEQNLSWFLVWPILALTVDPRLRLRKGIYLSLPHMVFAVLLAAALTAMSSDGQRQAEPNTNLVHMSSQFCELIRRAAMYRIYLPIAGIRSYHWPVLHDWWLQAPWKLLMMTSACTMSVAITIRVMIATRSQRQENLHLPFCFALSAMMLLAPILILTVKPGPILEPRLLHLSSLGFAVLCGALLHVMARRRRPNGVTSVLSALFITGLLFLGCLVTSTRSEEWVEGWRLQRQLVDAIHQELGEPSEKAVLVVDGLPSSVGLLGLSYANDLGLHFLVANGLKRSDVDSRTLLRRDETGELIAGGAGGLPVCSVGQRPLQLIRYDSGNGDFTRESLTSYQERYPAQFQRVAAKRK